MPLIWDNDIIEKVYVGDTELGDIYNGVNPLHHIYSVYYSSLLNINYRREDATWGIGLTLSAIPNLTNEEIAKHRQILNNDEVTFESDGWYGDPTCSYEKITKTSPTQFDDKYVYAKWLAKKKQYRITYAVSRQVIKNAPRAVDGDYPRSAGISVADWCAGRSSWFNAGSAHAGQCTWYANARTAQMHGGASAPYGSGGYPNACDWGDVARGSWEQSFNESDIRVGDVIVFKNRPGEGDGNGHVAVVEATYPSSHQYLLSHFNIYVDECSSPPTLWTFEDGIGLTLEYDSICHYIGGKRVTTTGVLYEVDEENSYYITDWVDSQYSYPSNAAVLSIEERYVYKIFDYSTEKWSSGWLEVKP